MVPGTGVMLNNEMDDFAAKAGVPNGFRLIGADANAVAPGKRPLSSMTPTFVEKEDGLMIVGSPGGSYHDYRAAVDARLAGRRAGGPVHQEGPLSPPVHARHVSFEPGALTEEEKQALQKYGHKLRESRMPGNAQIVTWDYRSGEVKAVSDPRGVGVGVVY